MWKIDDIVLYRTSGLCRIEDITTENFGGSPTDYYVLKPLGDEKSVIRIPCSSEVLCNKMHPLMTRDEIETLIKEAPTLSLEWQENDKRRAEYFKNVIESGNRRDIMALVTTVRTKRDKLVSLGKKLRASDEALMTRAEKMLADEFSHVLGKSSAEILELIK